MFLLLRADNLLLQLERWAAKASQDKVLLVMHGDKQSFASGYIALQSDNFIFDCWINHQLIKMQKFYIWNLKILHTALVSNLL